jgi:ABC-type nitrate/sulfonate/bicarbonate transport system permease component
MSETKGSAVSEAMLVRRKVIAHALPFETLSATLLEQLAAEAEEINLPEGGMVYDAGSISDDIYFVQTGAIRLEPDAQVAGALPVQIVRPHEAFGWTALASQAARRNRAVAVTPATLLRISGRTFIAMLGSDQGQETQQRIAGALADIRAQTSYQPAPVRRAGGLGLAMARAALWLRSPAPYLMLLGYALLLGFWYVTVQLLHLPRFNEMPGLTDVFQEWFSRNPVYGVSVFTPVYYQHILVSLQRIFIAFTLATVLGVPTGLFMGWSKTFRDYVFPVFELLRPIPPLAWVPLAIVMLPGSELPILYLTFLASFFATALNAMLGVRSIDPVYVQAANCLGASRARVFLTIIVPGALPYIFTGLQISIGVAWFSLVAAEMVSGQFGLGYLINTSYTTVQYPTMIIAMLTLGIVGYASSALVRLAGNWLLGWHKRQLALEGGA